jgi:hypothetical protein
MRDVARSIGLGRALYLLYHFPKSLIERSRREGGPLEQWRTAQGRRAMMAAAKSMPDLPASERIEPPVELHFLTGGRFWFQTVFCAWTFAIQAGRRINAVVLDDGTLAQDQFEAIARVCETATLSTNADIEARLDDTLPARIFPSLRAQRQTLPLMRKILDVHAGLRGWRLALDSDLLFFRRPDLLLDWLSAPTEPLRATDIQNAYGYPLDELDGLAGVPVPRCLNTGILGLRSDSIDWHKLEWWCAKLIAAGGPQYYQEQALVALMLAGQRQIVAPIDDYVIWPTSPEATACQAVMHHYVAESKKWYFQQNWRRVLS